MTEGVDVGGLRSESVVFRLEIADFGAFYERTYDTAYRTALGIIREPALAADVTQEAYVAAKLALGYALIEIPNGITRRTTAFFEPALDYLVCKYSAILVHSTEAVE